MNLGFSAAIKKVVSFFASFRVRVTLTLIFGMFFMVLMTNLVVHRFAMNTQFEQLRDSLKTLTNVVALTIDPEMVRAVPLNREGVHSEAYRALSEKLEKIKQSDPTIGFIYIMTRTEQEGSLQFVVDADPFLSRGGNLTAYPGDKYDASRFSEMLEAFEGAVVDREMGTDEWGTMLSGYAPIRDREGKTVAILGIDIMASDIYAIQQDINKRIRLVLLVGTFLSIIMGLWLSVKITRSVRALGEGIRQVSRGELGYRVAVSGKDEISGLSHAFNQMTEDLREARQKNQDYFYGVMQSLVRIVEARDSYTRGHSERVAEYSVKIAKRMGFSQKAVEMLRRVAVLHDIGKLGVHEDILKKPGRLTPEEWELIRQHPVIGEDILKPVLFDSEMLAVVRGHHERYDGKGYPDRLAGENINIFAQILSIADAYDAMTSTRPYRVALPKEQAIKEIQDNRNTQFSPVVADVFVGILKEEKD